MAIHPHPDTGTAPAAALGAARAEIAGLTERLPAGLSDDELLEAMAELQTVLAAAAGLEAVYLSEIDDRGLPKSTRHWGSTADWFAHHAGLHRREGRRRVVRAHALVKEHPATLAALAAGETSPTQAGVICGALEDLPPGRDLHDQAETLLLDHAKTLNATELAKAGRHLIEVVDPDGTERKAQQDLDREERAAHLDRSLSITEDGMGGVRIKGHGSVEDGATLRAALLPLTKPAPAVDPEDPDCATQTDPRDHGARMWDALIQLAQHALDTHLPPESHGTRPRIGITIPFEDLTTGLGWPAETEDGLTLSVAAVRRMACDADLYPICLGTHGEVLDVGRTARLVTPALWRALVARDGHCTFPSCTRPPVMCHAHHIVHWVDGGVTSLENLVLLCGEHHRVIHHTPWHVRLNPEDQHPEFLPPPRRHAKAPEELHWIRQRPRRE